MVQKHLKFMRTKTRIILIVIVFFSAVLRLYNLDTIPPHLTSDEAALGYNAYSILKTGRDEHGQLLPIVFKSFGDYKPGLYVYATIPFVATLGLNELSVRLPGAISGVVSVVLLYFIARALYPKKGEGFALIASAMLALSPWHMYFSRGAWEITLSLALTLAGILTFLKARSSPRFILLAGLFFGLTIVTYHGAKISTALVIGLLLLFYYQELKNVSKKILLGSTLVLGAIASPILASIMRGEAGRMTVFSIFSTPRPDETLSTILSQGGEHVGSPLYYLFHSESFNFLRGIVGRWVNHFSGQFLFFVGDWSNPRHSAPYTGMLTFMDLPLLIVGVFTLLRESLKKTNGFVLAWLVLSPLPAIFTRDTVHAVRSFNMVIPLTLILALGAHVIFTKKKTRKALGVIFMCIYIAGYVYFLDAYFVHLPGRNSKYWSYGYKQLVQELTPRVESGESIIFQQSYNQPYIYFLFYNKYDPAKYHIISQENYIPSPVGDVGQIRALETISFERLDWPVLKQKTGAIVVGDGISVSATGSQDGTNYEVLNQIVYLDKIYTAFRIVKIK